MRSRRGVGRKIGVVVALSALAAATLCWLPCAAQQIHHNGFESDNPVWVKGTSDAEFSEVAHTRTNEGAKEGQRSELIHVNSGQGSCIYYQYAVKQAPINEEFSASLWVKANRPGVQFVARLVLPNERDQTSLNDCLTTYLRGDTYRQVGGWRRLTLGGAVALAQKQQLLMQEQLKRPLNFKDCYVDQLLLNVYTGPGETQVLVDDLDIGPVIDNSPAQPATRVPGQPTPGTLASTQNPTGRAAVVEFNGSQLLVNGKRFFIRAIRHTDTPLKVLRNAGINVLWVDVGTQPEVLHQAAELGFKLVASVPGAAEDPQLVVSDNLAHEITHFPEMSSLICWDLGGPLTFRQTQQVMEVAKRVRALDPGRPVGADVWDAFQPYSRTLNLMGVHRWPLMTGMELSQYHDWLEQRGRLANPGTYMWTWVQTHAQDWYTNLVYDRPASEGFKIPVGPQPEQIKLLAYTALGAGCRGLGFWSDRFLADSHQGRDRLLGVALLNQELEMLEPLLVTADDPPKWITTSSEDVKAAVFRTAKGVLLLPMWSGKGAQFVPGQAAAQKVEIVVPQVPNGMQAWEVCPGDVRDVRSERVTGGTMITLRDFGLATAVVFTSDNTLLMRLQEQAIQKRQVAAQWSYDMALQELEKVVQIEQELERQAHTLPDSQQLLTDAQNRLRSAKEFWDAHMFAEAYHESQRALRPVRIMMRAQWDNAVKALDTPVASPYAVSFYSLPGHWQFMDQIKSTTPATNVLAGGDFEVQAGPPQQQWQLQDSVVDAVEVRAERVDASHVPPTPVLPNPPKTVTPKLVHGGGQTNQSTTSGGGPGGGTASATTFSASTFGSWTSKAAAAANKPRLDPPPKFAPQEGRLCLMLKVQARDPARVPLALERTYLALNSPTVSLPPGTLVQVSGWMYVPVPITASADGVMFYDSAGGEPLSLRQVESTRTWQKITLYRRVPASGTMNVTLALTGLGTVYFDDIRIEPLSRAGTDTVLRAQNR